MFIKKTNSINAFKKNEIYFGNLTNGIKKASPDLFDGFGENLNPKCFQKAVTIIKKAGLDEKAEYLKFAPNQNSLDRVYGPLQA